MGTSARERSAEVTLVNDFRSVRLPEELCDHAERWLKGRFDSLEALITFALQQIVNDDGAKLDAFRRLAAQHCRQQLRAIRRLRRRSKMRPGAVPTERRTLVRQHVLVRIREELVVTVG